MNKIMRQRGFERFSAECYFFDEIGNGIDELLVSSDEDELPDDIELDLVQEEDDDDEIMDELQQMEEFLAGGHHPEQSWDYSLRPGPSGLRRRAPLDDLIDLYAEDETYSEELYRLLGL
jgi:hypothetical protein